MSDLKSSGFANVGSLEDNRNIKALQNVGNKVTMGLGVPRQAEGKTGDITVRQVASVGLICYIKTTSGWHDINSLVITGLQMMNILRRHLTSRIVTDLYIFKEG